MRHARRLRRVSVEYRCRMMLLEIDVGFGRTALRKAPCATYFRVHKNLKLFLVSCYLVSFSQPQNAASILVLSRSHEFEHEVRREVTFQVKHWFGQVDDVDERWEMVVEKVVRQVGLFRISARLASASVFPFPRPHSSFNPNFCFWQVLTCRVTQYRRTSS